MVHTLWTDAYATDWIQRIDPNLTTISWTSSWTTLRGWIFGFNIFFLSWWFAFIALFSLAPYGILLFFRIFSFDDFGENVLSLIG